jgi:hypothetical protein
MTYKIHHLAVWVLVVVHFFIGLGWYALFGEVWLNYHARTMTDIERVFGVAPYLIAIVAAIFANYGLAWLIYKLHAHTALAGVKNRANLLLWLFVCSVRSHLGVRGV